MMNDISKIIIPILKSGGIGVLPTDTLYGVVGSALQKKTVERIYALRKRDLQKPMIILISSLNDLKSFGIKISSKQKIALAKFWPGKVSVVFDCPLKKFLPPLPKNLAKNDLLKNKQKRQAYPGLTNDYVRCGGEYLHRGSKTLAIRLPKDKSLLEILKKTGPLVAPSANMSGQDPAETYPKAKKYFADRVDFYVDAGKLKSKPSTLVRLDAQGSIAVLREGAVKI